MPALDPILQREHAQRAAVASAASRRARKLEALIASAPPLRSADRDALLALLAQHDVLLDRRSTAGEAS